MLLSEFVKLRACLKQTMITKQEAYNTVSELITRFGEQTQKYG